MGLDQIKDDWHCPPANLREDFGGVVGARTRLWDRIRSPDREGRHFFEQLKADVENGNQDVIAQWLDHPSEQQDDIMGHGDRTGMFRPLRPVFGAHLACGLEVARRGLRRQGWVFDFFDPDLVRELARRADDFNVPLGLMLDLAGELAGQGKRPPEHAIIAPFALVSEGTGAGGVLAQFRFERIAGGSGGVYITPEQAFIRMDASFHESVFHAAKGGVGKFLEDRPHACKDCDVRVSIQQFDPDNEVPGLGLFDPEAAGRRAAWFEGELRGRSASGAAAWGLAFVLTPMRPDPGMIVLAQADSAGGLSPIDDIRPKVRKIAEYDCFDAIVVVGSENRLDAEDALKDLGRGDDICVEEI